MLYSLIYLFIGVCVTLALAFGLSKVYGATGTVVGLEDGLFCMLVGMLWPAGVPVFLFVLGGAGVATLINKLDKKGQR